ncbi:manganese-dependent inorganic pyrophosphatase [Lacticigenium naphthae]|uniref:manganese-dependent inorganic pyrophosphatase n=1 Tax=Lacticigenium naphthae TaxID=515351 RepID=UPI0003FADD29|nr:manganese-dependent inorganic pyrophosphatase [Lacticigenium naphthae]
MSKILVFGHKSPDTDAVTSAISFAYLQNQLGKEAEAVVLGEIGAETHFALNHFETEAPRSVQTVANETNEVMLVDHNEFQQSVDDIEKVTILSVVDHHRISNFQTKDPVYYRAEPVGCTNTIIHSIYKENNVSIPKNIAGLMLSAIISDTLLFKSPTCTERDKEAAKELAEIAGTEIDSYGLDMLKAGTNVISKAAEEILEGDAKTFPMGDYSVRIGQVNVVDQSDVLNRKEELLETMKTISVKDKYDLYVLVITNILESDSVALVYGEPTEAVENAFNQSINNGEINLPGIMSRKKQVVPQLTKFLEK